MSVLAIGLVSALHCMISNFTKNLSAVSHLYIIQYSSARALSLWLRLSKATLSSLKNALKSSEIKRTFVAVSVLLLR